MPSFVKKVSSGGPGFVITQLGYDVLKFQETAAHAEEDGDHKADTGIIVLSDPENRPDHETAPKYPGQWLPTGCRKTVEKEWSHPGSWGKKAAIERSARLGAILKGMGYRGIHIGGIQRNFETVGQYSGSYGRN